MADKFRMTEMKRAGTDWEIKTEVPSNMIGLHSITMKVEAEINPTGGGLVERDLADVMKTYNRRIAYDLQRLANIAFEGMDKESVDMVRRVLLDEASKGSAQSSDLK